MFIFDYTTAEGDTIFVKEDSIVAIYSCVYAENYFIVDDDINEHISTLGYNDHKDYLKGVECIDTLTDGTKIYFRAA